MNYVSSVLVYLTVVRRQCLLGVTYLGQSQTHPGGSKVGSKGRAIF